MRALINKLIKSQLDTYVASQFHFQLKSEIHRSNIIKPNGIKIRIFAFVIISITNETTISVIKNNEAAKIHNNRQNAVSISQKRNSIPVDFDEITKQSRSTDDLKSKKYVSNSLTRSQHFTRTTKTNSSYKGHIYE